MSCTHSVSTECLRWKSENTAASLWPNPFVLPKLLNPQSINSAIELQAFHPEPACQTGVALHTLCPVRALRAYVDRTQQPRCAHTKQLGHPVSKQRLSHWLVLRLLAQAYFEPGIPAPEGLVAHSTCSMANSWAALKGIALGDICVEHPGVFHVLSPGFISTTVGATVLMTTAKQTVPRDTFGTSHP